MHKISLKYSILGNRVMKLLLYLCLILLWFRYLDGLPKTYFRKVEFNCKVQLSTSDLFWCPNCTSCPYVWSIKCERETHVQHLQPLACSGPVRCRARREVKCLDVGPVPGIHKIAGNCCVIARTNHGGPCIGHKQSTMMRLGACACFIYCGDDRITEFDDLE